MREQGLLDESRWESGDLLESERRTLTTILWSGLALIGGILLLRRLSGAFTRELTGFEYFWLMLIFCSVLAVSQASVTFDSDDIPRARRPRAILALLLVSIYIAGLQPLTSLWGWAVSLVSLVAVFGSAWFPRVIPQGIQQATVHLRAWIPELFPPLPTATSISTPSSHTSRVPHDSDPPELDESITSQLIRRIDAGRQIVQGSVQVRFEPGLKQTEIHIPFVPPLDSVANPQCEVQGDFVEVKLSALFSYGMRLEARRPSAEGPLTTTVHFELVVPIVG